MSEPKEGMLKLNIGAGHQKINGFINIDADASLEPDLVFDITNKLPYATGHVDEIRCFHTIEHIKGAQHPQIIEEFNRVLCKGGTLILAYPEAKECFEGWLTNKKGQRDFFEATILGRGLSYWDLHKTLMNSDLFIPLLREYGFEVSRHIEKEQTFNTVLICRKVFSLQTRESLFRKELLECSTA
jgi:predicted SAM-dependent methyltransferase